MSIVNVPIPVVARLVQGAAGGIVNPPATGLIQQLFPPRERSRGRVRRGGHGRGTRQANRHGRVVVATGPALVAARLSTADIVLSSVPAGDAPWATALPPLVAGLGAAAVAGITVSRRAASAPGG